MVFWNRRPRQHRQSRVIAVPVDGSANATEALSWAVRNLVQKDDHLHIVSVEEPTAGPYPTEVPDTDMLCPAPGTIRQHRQEVRQHCLQAARLLADHRQAACELGVKPSRVKMVQLPPQGGASGVAQSLVQYTDSSHASLVVVGSRGMDNFHRMWTSLWGLGSVSDYMVVHAKCPVVVVKTGSTKA